MSVLQKSLYSSPVKRNTNSCEQFTATPTPLNKQHKQMDSEMRKRFVGPMPVKDFLKDFLPVPSRSKKRCAALPSFAKVADVTTEAQMYNAFVRSPFVYPPDTPL